MTGLSTKGSVSLRVVRAVAEETGTDPTALPPLHDAVDPDALDAFFERGRECECQFRYADRRIRIRNGDVFVDEEGTRD